SGDNVYTESPAQTTILGAGKLTGRVGGYSVGVMTALTQQEYGTVLDATGRYERAVEPITSYTLARLRREFSNQSAYGLMMTATNRGTNDATAIVPDRSY